MKVKVVNKSKHPLPEYKTQGSAGLDIRANLEGSEVVLVPNQTVLIPTGIYLEIPIGYEAQIRPRSGLARDRNITVINSPATIDADYRGEVGVLLINHGKESYLIADGDRIAQLVFAKVELAELEVSTELNETERGQGGFGSTGKN